MSDRDWNKSRWQKFRSRRYRDAFVGAMLRRSIPSQIRTIRKSRGLTQKELAVICGVKQGVISRAENPNYGRLTLSTIIKIANGLDIAFLGEFVPFTFLNRKVGSFAYGGIKTFYEEDQIPLPPPPRGE